MSTSDGSVLITVVTDGSSLDFDGMLKGDQDIFVIKLDEGGSILRMNVFGGTAQDWSSSITTTSDGGILITGGTVSLKDGDFVGMGKGGESDIFVVKLDKDGRLVWKSIFGGSYSELGKSAHTRCDG